MLSRARPPAQRAIIVCARRFCGPTSRHTTILPHHRIFLPRQRHSLCMSSLRVPARCTRCHRSATSTTIRRIYAHVVCRTITLILITTPRCRRSRRSACRSATSTRMTRLHANLPSLLLLRTGRPRPSRRTARYPWRRSRMRARRAYTGRHNKPRTRMRTFSMRIQPCLNSSPMSFSPQSFFFYMPLSFFAF